MRMEEWSARDFGLDGNDKTQELYIVFALATNFFDKRD